MLGKGNQAEECEPKEDIDTYVDGLVQVNTKYISKYFNIDVYTKKKKLEYIGYQEYNTLLWKSSENFGT